MYVTYQDLIQMAIFIVALIGLIYQILKEKEKKQPPLPQIATADDPVRGLKAKCCRVEPLLWLPLFYIFTIAHLEAGCKKFFGSLEK